MNLLKTKFVQARLLCLFLMAGSSIAFANTEHPNFALAENNLRTMVVRAMGGGTTRLATSQFESASKTIYLRIGGFINVGEFGYSCNFVATANSAGALLEVSLGKGASWTDNPMKIDHENLQSPDTILSHCFSFR